MRQETCEATDDNYKRLAAQMRTEVKAQAEMMHRQQDAIMKRFRESENKIEETGKDAKTVYETEMEIIRNVYMRSESPSPLPCNGEKPATTGVLPVGSSG
jgi:vesicle coat complex subunit